MTVKNVTRAPKEGSGKLLLKGDKKDPRIRAASRLLVARVPGRQQGLSAASCEGMDE